MPETPLLPLTELANHELNGKAKATAQAGKCIDFQHALDQMRQLQDGWNGYAAPAPNDNAIKLAEQICLHLQSDRLEPNRVAPSVIGGIGITRRNGKRKVYVEVRNDGRTYALLSDGIDQATRQVEMSDIGLSTLSQSMREYLDA
jgi:hypothetical protein